MEITEHITKIMEKKFLDRVVVSLAKWLPISTGISIKNYSITTNRDLVFDIQTLTNDVLYVELIYSTSKTNLKSVHEIVCDIISKNYIDDSHVELDKVIISVRKDNFYSNEERYDKILTVLEYNTTNCVTVGTTEDRVLFTVTDIDVLLPVYNTIIDHYNNALSFLYINPSDEAIEAAKLSDSETTG